jgi:hypothetical protein
MSAAIREMTTILAITIGGNVGSIRLSGRRQVFPEQPNLTPKPLDIAGLQVAVVGAYSIVMLAP